MSYATRTQLLDRCNLLRLAQLAVPTGYTMPEPTLVRAALLADTQALAGLDTQTASVLADAVVAVDTALADGADLMRGHQVPVASTWTGANPVQAVPQVLVRLNCQLAMHYLAERAGMLAESDNANYKAICKLLAQHASGAVSLVPDVEPAPGATPSTDVAVIYSSASRYGTQAAEDAL